MDRRGKLIWIAMLEEDSRCAGFHDLKSCRIGHARGHHRDLHDAMATLEVNEQAQCLVFAVQFTMLNKASES